MSSAERAHRQHAVREVGSAGLRRSGPRRRAATSTAVRRRRSRSTKATRMAARGPADPRRVRSPRSTRPSPTAVAAGYRESTVYVPCIGAHYTNVGLAPSASTCRRRRSCSTTARPDSTHRRPELPRVPPGRRARRLRRAERPLAPAHLQRRAVHRARAGSSSARRARARPTARRRGGHKIALTDIWMLHDWVVPGWECSWGVFAAECPELGGKIGPRRLAHLIESTA